MFDNVYAAFDQVIRLAQLVCIPVFAVLCAIGFILLLTAGKNPMRKRRGLIFVLAFGVGTFLIAYVPAIVHTFAGDTPGETSQYNRVEQFVDSAVPLGSLLFVGLKYVAIPVTGTMFYVGFFVRLMAGKNPARKRLGIGLSMFAPATMAIVLAIPMLLPQL